MICYFHIFFVICKNEEINSNVNIQDFKVYYPLGKSLVKMLIITVKLQETLQWEDTLWYADISSEHVLSSPMPRNTSRYVGTFPQNMSYLSPMPRNASHNVGIISEQCPIFPHAKECFPLCGDNLRTCPIFPHAKECFPLCGDNLRTCPIFPHSQGTTSLLCGDISSEHVLSSPMPRNTSCYVGTFPQNMSYLPPCQGTLPVMWG